MSNNPNGTGTCKGLDCSLRDLAKHQEVLNSSVIQAVSDAMCIFEHDTGLTMQHIGIELEQVSTIGDEVPKYVVTRVISEPAINR